MAFLERFAPAGLRRMPGARGGSAVPLEAVPPVWIGVLAIVEVAVLRWISHGRYLPLTKAENASALLWAHSASQALVIVLLLVFGAGALRADLNAPLVRSAALRRGLLLLNLGAFAGLIMILPRLPTLGPETALGLPGILAFATAIFGLSLLCLAGIALVAPRSFRPVWTLAVFGGAWLALLASFGRLNWLFEGGRALVEGTTLDLTLWFYGLTGRPLPALFDDNGTPVMAVPTFAVEIAPSCSGYQGMVSAAILLGTCLALNRRALRLGPAFLLCVFAVGTIFVLNALRIAVLFYIGEEISPEIAVNGFHSQFGALSILGVSVLAILAMEHPVFRRAGREAAGSTPKLAQGELERIALLMIPLVLYLIAAMATGLFVGSFNWLYPVPVAAAALVLWGQRHRLLKEVARPPRLAAVTVGVITYFVWIALIAPDPERADLLATTLSQAPLWLAAVWIVFRILGSSIVVPVIEELAFRGGLVRLIELVLPISLSRTTVAGLALLGSSVAFGLLHSHILAGMVAGVMFGAIYLWRRALSDAIVAHAVTNFLICLHVLGLGEWSYW